MRCEPGDRACENQRRYYQTNFDRPNPYHPKSRDLTIGRGRSKIDKNRPTESRPDLTPIFEDGEAIRTDASRPDRPDLRPGPDRRPGPIEGTNASRPDRPFTAPLRPLKTISKLTPEQIEKGRMIAAAYEVDSQINAEMEYTGQQNATDNVLLQKSDAILRQTELSDYKVIENLSDKQYLVLEKGNNVQVVFRGRAGDNVPDNTHVADTLKGKVKDYAYIDELMGELQIMRPNADIGVVSYSNGGPKGLYMAEKYGLPHYTVDPVLGPREVTLLTSATGHVTSKLVAVWCT